MLFNLGEVSLVAVRIKQIQDFFPRQNALHLMEHFKVVLAKLVIHSLHLLTVMNKIRMNEC